MKKIIVFLMVVFTLGISSEAYSHGNPHGHNKHKHKKPKKQPKKKSKHCDRKHHHGNNCFVVPRGIDKIIIKL